MIAASYHFQKSHDVTKRVQTHIENQAATASEEALHTGSSFHRRLVTFACVNNAGQSLADEWIIQQGGVSQE